MADKIDAARRSANMAAIRSRDTKPELIVRRLVYGFGFRYRLNVKVLPGKPDLVLRRLRKIILVHGCFWHQHPKKKCLDARLPRSHKAYWLPKLRRNQARDRENLRALRRLGWRALVIWECETKHPEQTAIKIIRFLK